MRQHGWGETTRTLVPWSLGGKGLGVGVNQLVHWFLEGKGLGIQQGISVWVGSPKSCNIYCALGIKVYKPIQG